MFALCANPASRRAMSALALSSSSSSLTKKDSSLTKKDKKKKVLVLGGTGATGKHAVRMLMDRGDTTVVALARSREKMTSLLNELDDKDEDGDGDGDGNLDDEEQKKKAMERLTVKEASVADLSSDDIGELTKDCDAIIWCV